MRYQQVTSNTYIQDSLLLEENMIKVSDTSDVIQYEKIDSASHSLQQSTIRANNSDTLLPIPAITTDTIHRGEIKLKTQRVTSSSKPIEKNKSEQIPDTFGKVLPKSTFNKFSFTDSTEKKFSYAPVTSFLVAKEEEDRGINQFHLKEYNNQKLELNWTLIIGMASILLLLSLKRYYKKFIIQVASTMVNYQHAEKMLREKNIIVRRAFFILNLNFVLVVSLFLLTLTIFWDYRITDKYILDYFILLGIVLTILIVRLVSLYITGYLFGNVPAISEHIHVSFLVNKNLGLLMLPIVFLILYTSAKISEIAIYFCLVMLAIAAIYKIFRGFQIIIRNGVFIFYAILYLCTLELLPIVVGSKIIISLR